MTYLRKIKILVLLLLLFIPGFSQEKIRRPKLVVGIVVDQMRWDYLYRYYDRYRADGFKRLMDKGFVCENVFIDYVPTVTAAGHSSIYTGSIPAIHGITGNSITFNTTGETLNCVEDHRVKGVGVGGESGQRSPVHLLSNTIGDELKLATNFRSRVFGIALKDRGAILSAGHAADAAYWWASENGNWVSSTYYMEALPAWVEQFNGKNLTRKYLEKDWNTLYDILTYDQSTKDDNPFEGVLNDQQKPVFPIETSVLFSDEDFGVLSLTPYGNQLTIDFARALIENEGLGQGDETDFLTISLSSTDAIGHRFGVNSIEMEDTYLRLDKELAAFFEYLDEVVGSDDYLLFLTADHGASQNRKFLAAHKLPVHPSIKSLPERLSQLIDEKFGAEGIISKVKDDEVWFNFSVIEENNLDADRISAECERYILKEENIPFVINFHNLGDAVIPDKIKMRVVNGYHSERSGEIRFILHPNSGSLKRTGSSHGVWNPYDSKIPLLWMGWGITTGRSYARLNITDIAPTLAGLLKIQPPNGSIGDIITEVIKN